MRLSEQEVKEAALTSEHLFAKRLVVGSEWIVICTVVSVIIAAVLLLSHGEGHGETSRLQVADSGEVQEGLYSYNASLNYPPAASTCSKPFTCSCIG